MSEIILDSFLDSLKVFALAFLFFFLFSFFDGKIKSFLTKKKEIGPLVGAISGVIPQCAIPIIGSDLCASSQISAGTLVAIYLASSDEALPIIFTDFNAKWYMGFLLILIKILTALIAGYVFDLLLSRFLKKKEENTAIISNDRFFKLAQIHDKSDDSALHKHFLHPLFHSLKIFIYTLLVTFFFELLVESLGGAEGISSFLHQQYYLSPLYASLIGLIPSCASSVVLTETYLNNVLPFGALVAGLSINAGLGPLYLLSKDKSVKNFLFIEATCLLFALGVGYLLLLFPLP